VRTVAFHTDAFEQFTAWAAEDKKMFERITRLIVETAREPFAGIGKPEPLKHELKGFWSRRISDAHRLVYKATDDTIIVVSCRYHY
jgi:toxin YoeB